jgi:hypothetical protein
MSQLYLTAIENNLSENKKRDVNRQPRAYNLNIVGGYMRKEGRRRAKDESRVASFEDSKYSTV